MATIENALKLKLEHLLGMGGGYVLNYSNASFADFVRDSIGINPYELHNGSKAQVLRHLWFALPNSEFAKLTIDMLEYRRLSEDLGHLESDDRTAEDRRLAEGVIDQLRPLLNSDERLTGEEAAFLARDVEFDLSQVAVEVDFQSVVADRLKEVEACYKAARTWRWSSCAGARSRAFYTRSRRTTLSTTTRQRRRRVTAARSARSQSGRSTIS